MKLQDAVSTVVESRVAHEIESVLNVLATKLGTGAEHLWEVLCRQALVEFQASLAWFGIFVMILIFSLWGSLHTDDDLEAFLIGATVVSGIITVVALFACLVTLPGALNPEYFALKEVLNALP